MVCDFSSFTVFVSTFSDYYFAYWISFKSVRKEI